MYISNNGNFKEGIIFWDTNSNPNADVDVFFYIHDYDKRAENAYGFKSLELNLSKMTQEDIFNQYKSNLRNEIRKSETLDFDIKHITNPTDEQIKNFVELYNSFADFKKLQHTSFDLLKQIANDGKLVISQIYKDDILLACHSHYVATGRARLYHSFSTNNEFDNKINGLANKFLTHKDIAYFKDNNFEVYDFGGIGNVEGDNSRFEGIIRFKKQFGGEEVILWKGVTPNGQRGIEVYNKYWK